MLILVAAGALAWRARPALRPASRRRPTVATARAVWALFALGAVTIFAGTAATAAGPHAGGSGTGDVVDRLSFKRRRHARLARRPPRRARRGARAAAVGTWWLARRRGADRELRVRLTRVCLLMAPRACSGIVQYRLKLPAEIVWVHVALATLLWVGIVLAAMQVGSPVREPTAETAEAGAQRRRHARAGRAALSPARVSPPHALVVARRAVVRQRMPRRRVGDELVAEHGQLGRVVQRPEPDREHVAVAGVDSEELASAALAEVLVVARSRARRSERARRPR